MSWSRWASRALPALALAALAALPAAAADLKAAAEDVTGHPVAYAVNSHWHLEHYQGNQVFASDASILGTASTRVQIMEGNPPRLAREKAEYPGELRELEDKLALMHDGPDRTALAQRVEAIREYVEALPTIEVTPPNITFDRQLSLYGSARTVELIELGGGHSVSDTVTYLPEDGVLFTGDLLTVNQHPYCLEGNLQDWIKALNELLQFNANKVVPGHGPLGTPHELATVRSYLTEIGAGAAAFAESGAPLAELQKVTIPEPYAGWRSSGLYQANFKHLVEQLRP